MPLYSIAIALIALGLEALIIIRGSRQKALREMPLFYSYVAYQFAGTATTVPWGWVHPQDYPLVFWFYFLVSIFAEFAVLVEVCDRIFVPYPVLRKLGRFATVGLSAILFAFYIMPSLFSYRPSGIVITDLAKRSSLAKAVIIFVLLAAVRYYRLPLGSSVSGILLGFSVYLGTNIANFALNEVVPWSIYAPIFAVVGPMSFTLCLLIWAITLWRLEPAGPGGRKMFESQAGFPRPLGYRLTRFNTTLTRLLGK